MLTNPIKPTQLKGRVDTPPPKTEINGNYSNSKTPQGKAVIYKALLDSGVHYFKTTAPLARNVSKQLVSFTSPLSAHYATTKTLPRIKPVDMVDRTVAKETLGERIQQAIKTGEYVIFYCSSCQRFLPSPKFMPSRALRYTPCRTCVNEYRDNNQKRKDYQSAYYKTQLAKEKRKAYYQSDKYKQWRKEYDQKLKTLGTKTLKEAEQQ